MRRNAFISLAIKLLLFTCAVLMSYWVAMPPFALVALTVCGIVDLDASVAAIRGDSRTGPWRLIIVWSCTLLAPLGLFFANRESENRELFFMVATWLVAGSFLGTSYLCGKGEVRRRWMALSLVWALWGTLTCFMLGYLQNRTLEFYIGLALSIGLLLAAKCFLRLPAVAVLSIHTLLILAVLLPLTEIVFRPRYRIEANPEAAKKYYSYTIAKKDSRAFARWWAYYGEQWQKLERNLYVRDGATTRAYHLRPGSEYVMFRSRISINSKGFRGKEISENKGTAYRIVALGESTTFGATLRPEDKPWPEVLEQLIQEQLKPGRPVEVINAGVPGWTLQENLRRLSTDILPLKPDMIVSYHGFNGFHWWYGSISPPNGPALPRQQERPIQLLANAEYGLQMFLYKRRLGRKGASDSPPSPNPSLEGVYADLYRQLIKAARTNGIKLVLGTFSMAANSRSDPEIVAFYRSAFGFVHQQISANELHSALVHKLAQDHPEVLFVDTRPKLDGEHEKFIDLIHLTQEGRQQLAENFFEGLRDVLSQELDGNNSLTEQERKSAGISH